MKDCSEEGMAPEKKMWKKKTEKENGKGIDSANKIHFTIQKLCHKVFEFYS